MYNEYCYSVCNMHYIMMYSISYTVYIIQFTLYILYCAYCPKHWLQKGRKAKG